MTGSKIIEKENEGCVTHDLVSRKYSCQNEANANPAEDNCQLTKTDHLNKYINDDSKMPQDGLKRMSGRPRMTPGGPEVNPGNPKVARGCPNKFQKASEVVLRDPKKSEYMTTAATPPTQPAENSSKSK